MRKRPDPVHDAVKELEEDMARTRVQLAQAYQGFNTAADQELVESYIYEIQALRVRYSCLLRQRKELEPSSFSPAALPVA